jgi:hypothetical protein
MSDTIRARLNFLKRFYTPFAIIPTNNERKTIVVAKMTILTESVANSKLVNMFYFFFGFPHSFTIALASQTTASSREWRRTSKLIANSKSSQLRRCVFLPSLYIAFCLNSPIGHSHNASLLSQGIAEMTGGEAE